MTDNTVATICQSCGARHSRCYQLYSFASPGELNTEQQFVLCVSCARAERRRSTDRSGQYNGLTRHELIVELDRFFAASGLFDICRRCHEQGTGCCPPTCRVMGERGCDPNNKLGKTVFCAAFVCGALLNAISECDAEIGRTIKWVKNELGPAEYHIYQMITRVPSQARESLPPLALPKRYPRPGGLEDGGKIREKLSELSDEVLEIRRRWSE